MTAQCGGGTSAPKPSLPLELALTAGNVAALFDLASVPWLIPVLAVVDIGSFLLSSFCASDPPAMPTFTTAEINALLNVTPGADFASGAVKMPALIANVVWSQYCQCTSGALVPFSYPAQPTGTPTYTPPPSPVATPCLVNAPHTRNSVGLSSTLMAFDIFASTFGTFAVVKATGVPTSGAGTRVILMASTTDVSSVEQVGNYEQQMVVPANGSIEMSFALPLNTHGLEFDGTSLLDGGQSDMTWHSEIYCGAAPASPQQPCCPPDPATQASLDLILTLVTLIQRQVSPFGYIASTSHAGLTGAGSLTVTGLIGAKILATAFPVDYGSEAGDPDTLWLDSWINWGNADGWTAREFLRASPHLSLPPLAGQFTKLGYSLRPGLTVTIEELTREP